jgi:hypothetical protein
MGPSEEPTLNPASGPGGKLLVPGFVFVGEGGVGTAASCPQLKPVNLEHLGASRHVFANFCVVAAPRRRTKSSSTAEEGHHLSKFPTEDEFCRLHREHIPAADFGSWLSRSLWHRRLKCVRGLAEALMYRRLARTLFAFAFRVADPACSDFLCSETGSHRRHSLSLFLSPSLSLSVFVFVSVSLSCLCLCLYLSLFLLSLSPAEMSCC